MFSPILKGRQTWALVKNGLKDIIGIITGAGLGSAVANAVSVVGSSAETFHVTIIAAEFLR
jgi:hypothetical protein